jgi:TonB family protein
VRPPTVVRQGLPEYDKSMGPPGQGILDIVIDESGNVEMVMLRGSIHPKYDSEALAAARNWRYKPATRYGVPVKFSKAITIAVKF